METVTLINSTTVKMSFESVFLILLLSKSMAKYPVIKGSRIGLNFKHKSLSADCVPFSGGMGKQGTERSCLVLGFIVYNVLCSLFED